MEQDGRSENQSSSLGEDCKWWAPSCTVLVAPRTNGFWAGTPRWDVGMVGLELLEEHISVV